MVRDSPRGDGEEHSQIRQGTHTKYSSIFPVCALYGVDALLDLDKHTKSRQQYISLLQPPYTITHPPNSDSDLHKKGRRAKT